MKPSVLISFVLGSLLTQAQAAEKPAAADAAKSPDETVESPVGTTIIGDQESPIGLYITPWKDDYAERGLDRPARLLDEALLPIDPATFRRQIEYYDTITTYRRNQRERAAGAGKSSTP